MSTTVEVLARLKADTSDFSSGMRKANAEVDALQRNVSKSTSLFQDSAGRWRNASGQYASSAEKAAAGVNKTHGALKGLGGAAAGVGIAFGAAAAGVSVLTLGAMKFASAAQESVALGRTIEQVIKSTGGAAGVTAQQVDELATSLSNKTGIDDEAILSGQRLLLTFKNVKNVGEGQAAMFDRASAAALDLSRTGFGSIDSAAKMLGKALNDPERGLTALSRAGVTFTQQQKDQVAALVASGDMLKAQALIMEEVESQVGGVAEAARNPMEALQTMFGNLQEQVGMALLPVLDQLGKTLQPVLAALGPPLAAVAETIGGVLTSAIGALAPVLQPLASGLQAVGELFGTVLTTAIQGLVPVVTPLIELITQIAGLLGPILQPVLQAIAPVFEAVGAVVAALAPAFIALLQAAGPIVQMFAGQLGAMLQMLLPLFVQLAEQVGGFLAQAFTALAPVQKEFMGMFMEIANAILPPVIEVLGAVFDAVLPLLPTLAQLIGVMALMAQPVMALLRAFAPLVGVVVQLLAAALAPLLRLLGPLINMLVRLLTRAIEPLIPYIDQGTKAFSDFGAKGVAVAASLLRSYARFVDFMWNQVFKPIVDGAAQAFGWLPGIGGDIQNAAASFGNFASSTVANINGVAASLDGVARGLSDMSKGYTIPVTLAVSERKMTADQAERMANANPVSMPSFSPTAFTGGGGGSGAGSGGANKGPDYKGMLQSLREARKDLIKTLEGMGAAVVGSVDDIKAYFDDLSQSAANAFKQALALAKNKAQRDKIRNLQAQMQQKLQGLQAQLLDNARQREAISKQIEEARDALAQAQQDRAQAQEYFQGLLARPFGEPSQLDRALQATTVTVDGILDLYSGLAEQVKKRFALLRDANGKLLKGLDQQKAIAKRDEILQALQAQTARLIQLVKQRDRIAAELQKATEKYQAVLSEQTDFVNKIKSGMRGAFSDLAGLNDAASFGGADAIVTRLQDRVKALRDYSSNIQRLLSMGVNQDLMRQIIEAGPGQNQSLIQALLTAGPQDIAAINEAQTQASAIADQFATQMGEKWYGQAVAEAKAYMDGWQSQYDSVIAQIDATRAAIEATIAPLADGMEEIGFDSAWAFIDGLQGQEQRLLDIATDMGNAMGDAVASAINAAIQVANDAARQIGAPLIGFVKAPKIKAPQAKKRDKPDYKSQRQRALGGPVMAGLAYTVGERGRELFVPGTSGRVISNRRMEGMGGMSINVEAGAIQVVATGSDASQVVAEVERAVQDMFRKAAREAALARRA